MKLTMPKLWVWYVAAGLGVVATYHHIVDLLSEQFSVYTLHMGNEASYIVIFTIAGYLVNRYSVKRWGKFGIEGFVLLTVVLVAITAILMFVFGYMFFE